MKSKVSPCSLKLHTVSRPIKNLQVNHVISVPNLFSATIYNEYIDQLVSLKEKQIPDTLNIIKETVEKYFNVHCRSVSVCNGETLQLKITKKNNAYILVHIGDDSLMYQKKNGIILEHVLSNGFVLFLATSVCLNFEQEVVKTSASETFLMECTSFQI